MRAACVFLLGLAGCTTTQETVHVRTVDVVQNVPVECIQSADLPNRPEPLPELPADARQALNVALAKLVEWGDPESGYGVRANAILAACTKR